MSYRKKFPFLIITALLCLALLAGCGEAANEPVSAPEPETASTPEPTPAVPTPTPDPEPEPEEPVPTPEAQAEEEIYCGPDLASQDKVSDDYFSDALFVGNSLVHGLWGYGGITTADFCAATSASVVNLDRVRNEAQWGESEASLMDTMAAKQYGKVYVLLGINEIGFETEDFISIYSGVLDRIGEIQPEAELYIMGLTPLTEEKDAGGYPFTMERVLDYNRALRELAAERECWYVDLVDALADEAGYLPEADSTDGIHLTQEKYPLWADYLRTHYADAATN